MTDLRAAAQALVDRWDTPNWKDAPHTGKYIDALRQALAADQTRADLFASAGWQPIATAPKDGTWILVWPYLGRVDTDYWHPATSERWLPWVTHWMPLPAAPSPQEQT